MTRVSQADATKARLTALRIALEVTPRWRFIRRNHLKRLISFYEGLVR